MRSLGKSLVRSVRNQMTVPLATRGVGPLRSLFGGRDDLRDLEMYGKVGTLFAVVNLLATSTSQVNWRLFRHSDARGRISGPDPRREVTAHAALDMWNQPNDFMTRQLFVESFQQHLELTGKAFWVVDRGPGGIPLSMWPVRPDRMTPVPSEQDFLAGWIYTGPQGEKVPLARDTVIWLRMPDPIDPYDGAGPVGSILPDLESSRATSEWNRAFFQNSAQPGGLITVEKRLSDPEFEEMTARWAEQHQGVRNAHRVAILEQGATWESNSYTQRDMQFIELRKDARDIVYEAYGVSKGMLGVVEDVNRSNIEGSEYIFAKYKLVNRLERIKGVFNGPYLSMFGMTGQGLEADYDNPVPDDWQADSETLKTYAHAALELIEAGYDPDDVASGIGLPAMKYIGPPAKLPLPKAVPDAGPTDDEGTADE